MKAEAFPEIGTHDELHDALVVHGYLTVPEVEPWKPQLARLREERRVIFHEGLWVAVERSVEFERAREGDTLALAEVLRGRLEFLGPVSDTSLAVSIDLPVGQVLAAGQRPQRRGPGGDGVVARRAPGLGPGRRPGRRPLVCRA